jgi:26S proteasome regulatory subunit (ATPase 3-interacting protein)
MATMDERLRVLKYFRDQNRPCDINEIFENLRDQFQKSAIQDAVDHHLRHNLIIRKVYDNENVYMVSQNANVRGLLLELEDLDSQLNDISEILLSSEQELKESENQLHDLQSGPTTQEAQTEQKILEERIDRLNKLFNSLPKITAKVSKTDKERVKISETGKEQMEVLETDGQVKISDADKEQIYSDRKYRVEGWIKKKKVCMDIVDSVLEFYPDTKMMLMHEMGIDTDEKAGILLIL